MKTIRFSVLPLFTILAFPLYLNAQQPVPSATSAAVVPRLVSFSGKAVDAQGKPLSGIAGVTFTIYKGQSDGAPLWMETQNVQADSKGNYSIQLGATKSDGLPVELFASGEARWLGVRVNGGEEQARVMLLSVPYALKAGDAATIGGLPPSAFVLAALPSGGAAGSVGGAATSNPVTSAPPPASTVTTSGGTVNALPLWTTATNVQSSAITQTGSGATAKIGINTTAPTTALDVHGGSAIRGTLVLPATGAATASAGKVSQPENFVASSFSSATSTPVNQTFQWQATPTNNNTSTPGATLSLLYGLGATAPAQTGLRIGPKGIVGFAPGQTFPGTGPGTVKSVGLTAPASDFTVSGSPVTGTGTLNFAWTVTPTSADTANAMVKRDGSGGFSAGAISATALTASTMGLGTAAPTERLDLGNDGNVVISTFPTSDSTPDSVAYSLVGRGAGGTINKWSIFTAPVGGGYGVPANSLSIWQYPPNQSPGCCLERFTISPSTPGQAVYPVTIDGTGVIHGAVFANTPRDGNAIIGMNNSGNYTLSLQNSFSYGGGIFYGSSVNGYCIIDGNADLMCSGSKSAVVPVDAGVRKVALYAVESPQNWFEDFGSGRLSNGETIIALEPTFAQTVNTTNGYHVFLTPRGECEGLYVSNVNANSFTVRELHHGVSNVEFDFRIVAPRKGYENIRLADKTSLMNAKPQVLSGKPLTEMRRNAGTDGTFPFPPETTSAKQIRSRK
jgi:hypothetical protein